MLLLLSAPPKVWLSTMSECGPGSRSPTNWVRRAAPARIFCGLTQPAPEVPFFSKRKEPKIRQRGSILFGFSSKGHIPSGTSQAKFSPPVCSASGRMSGFAPATSGSKVLLSSVLSTDTVGFQKGSYLTPFVGGSLGVSGPSGPDCVFGDFLHTRKSPRCGARSSTMFLQGFPRNILAETSL